MFKHGVAETIGFTIFSKIMLLKHLTVDMFKINVAKTGGFSNIMFGNVVKAIGVATLCWQML